MGWVDRKRIVGAHHGLGGHEQTRRGTLLGYRVA